MTERVLPAIAVPVPGRRVHEAPAPRGVPVARPVAVHRKETFLTTPARAGMLLGGVAAVYAISLAGIAALQSSSDAAVAARRQPWLDAAAEARAANDALAASIARADADARWLAGSYDGVTGDISAFQARLDALATLVAEVEGSAAALPARIALPTVTMRGPIASSGGTRAPATTATSGASGH